MIDTYAANIGNNNIADKYLKNSCDSVTYPILRGLAYTGWYVYKSSVYICIIYLHEIEVCSKDTIAIFYFFSFEKSFKYYEYLFLIPSLYFLEINKKQMCYKKINLYF